MSEFGNGFLWSFGFGGVIILLFAYDQLNRPSYHRARELARFLDLLRPADIRNHSIFLRAYFFYALLMLFVYAAACFGGAVGVAALFGPESAPDGAVKTAWDPRTPLVVSLMMVGLMPNPNGLVFNTIEKKLRSLSHRLVGIPNSLFDRCDALNRTPLERGDLDDETAATHVIVQVDQQDEAARSALHETNAHDESRLEKALIKIAVCRVWVLDRDVWPSTAVRERYIRLEREIRDSINSLDAELNLLVAAARLLEDKDRDPEQVARMLGVADASPESVGTQVDMLRQAIKDRWIAVIGPADELSRDLCALMMLYLEQDHRFPDNDVGSIPLVNWLVHARNRLRGSSAAFDALVAVTVVMLVVVALGGVVAQELGFTPGESSHLESALSYMLTSLCTYGPPMIVAMSIRDARLDLLDYKPAFSGELAGRQFAMIFIWGGVASLVFVVMSNLLVATAAVGFETIINKIWAVLRYALQIEWPRALMGGIQGLFVVLAADLSSKQASLWRTWLPLIHGFAFFAFGVGATLHTASIYGAAIRESSLLYQGALAGLLGFATTFVLVRLLKDERSLACAEIADNRPAVSPRDIA